MENATRPSLRLHAPDWRHTTSLALPAGLVRAAKRLAALLAVAGALALCFAPAQAAPPKPGEPFPALDNRVENHPERNCTRRDPCPFQRLTVREALTLDKPIFISFSDPVHCVTCRVVLKVMGELEQKYGDRIALVFINTRKDEAIIKQLKLFGHPWNVYVDRHGLVVKRFPGEITLEGASAVLDALLKG